MIFYDEKSRRFECNTDNSYYACHVSDDNRLSFIGWGAKPVDHNTQVVTHLEPPRVMNWPSQESFKNFDEVGGYGDESLVEPAISASIPEVPVRPGIDAPHFPVRDLRLRFVGHRIGKPDLPYAGTPTHGRPTLEAGGDWLILTLRNVAYPFEVDLCLRPAEKYDILERYLIVRNAGDQPVTLGHAWAASLQLPFGEWNATHLYGCWGKEFTREQIALPVGSTLFESRTINTSLNHQPTVMLQKRGRATRVCGETYGAQLAWSGNWRIHLEAGHDKTLRLHLGENPTDSTRILAPGESFATPVVLAGFSSDGEEGLRRNFQAFHYHRTIAQAARTRPVLYNSWEATYFELTVENQIALARKAADIGVELFVVDDGWFGGRRHEKAGLGDWVVSKDVFPDGLNPLIEEVHRLGMQFGIWFEPEMVNPDSDLYRAHPDWVLHYPSTERCEGRCQLLLDFGNPDVVENIRTQMETFLDAHPVDFIKWDMNRSANGAGSKAGERIWRKHVEGVHSIMDGLLKRFPKLSIQSCSSGGGRTDASMLARCCQVWTSDNTDALDRVRIQDGYALTYPTVAMECWVTHEHNHQTQRHQSLALRFATAMRGVLGIGSTLSELPDEELAEYKRLTTFYKQVRHLVQHGTLHRAALPEIDQGLSVWQFTAADGSESYVNAILATHTLGTQVPYYRLADLTPEATYLVSDINGKEVLQATGLELMHFGLTGNDTGVALATAQGSCWHYYCKRI